MNMLLPILLIVASNAVYNICAKSTPSGINTFASLSLTYFIGMVLALLLFFVTGESKNLAAELAKTNWASYVLGIAIVGLECGFLLAYRAGWKISMTQLVSSIAVSCVLLIIGMAVYHEVLTAKQLVGIGVCAVGLFLIA